MREYEKQLDSISAAIKDPREVVLLVGAGISVPAPSSCPTWKQATEKAFAESSLHDLRPGAKAYAKEELKYGNYYNVFQLIKEQLTDALFSQILSHVFGVDGKHPNRIHKLIAQSGVKGVITTNFDPFVEVAFASLANTEARKAAYDEDPRLREILSNMDRFFVVKLHGDIGVPDSLVVTPGQCEAVSSKGLVQDLFHQIVMNYQLVVIGYSFRDPDFRRLWENTLLTLNLRSPAIICLPREASQPDAEELQEHNLFCVSFDNSDRSYSFVPSFLERIGAMQSPRSVHMPVQPAEVGLQPHLNQYVYLYCQLSENREDRFLAFMASLCLAELIEEGKGSPSLPVETLRKRVRRQLGLTSARVNSDLSRALARLSSQGMIGVKNGMISLESHIRKSLSNLHIKLRDQERTILSAIIVEVGGEELVTDAAVVDGMRDVVDEVLRWLGWELAEQVLFAKLPDADDKEHVKEVVRNYCVTEGLDASLYETAVDRLIFAMTEEEEDWFSRKLQAHFLTSAYVIHPTSERLLREYASKHILFLDSSVALPAIAEGHPLNSVYSLILHRSSRLGVRLRISANMLEEVIGHLRIAIRQFEDLDDGNYIREKLEAYVKATGPTQGNVFVEAFLGQLRLGAVMSWRQSLDHLCIQKAGRLLPDKSKVIDYLSDTLSVQFDDFAFAKEMEGEINRLTQDIYNMRVRRQALSMGTAWTLSQHEAEELLHIQSLREHEVEKEQLIWFLTTDTHLARLQVKEMERYPIPVAYYPHSWSQYLDLLDYEERSSKHFSQLLRRAEYGVFTGDAAIALVKKLSARFREAKAAAAEAKIAELVSQLLQNYRLKQALREASQREREGLPPDERAQKVLNQALDAFVIKTQKDWNGLQRELEESSAERKERDAEIASLRRRLKAKDHHIGVLRGELKRKGH